MWWEGAGRALAGHGQRGQDMGSPEGGLQEMLFCVWLLQSSRGHPY